MISSLIPADARTRGIAAILVGMLAISLQDSLIKLVSDRYPLHEIVLSRAVLAIALTLVIVHFEGGLAMLRTRRLGTHLVRAALIVIANMCFFLSLAVLPLAEAVALFFVAPLFITALSVPILKEKVGPWRWGAVVFGLAGVIVMVRPGGDVFEPASLLPVGAAFAYACMQMLTRRLGATEKASTMAFFIHFTFIIASVGMGLVAGDGKYAGDNHPSLEFLLRAWSWPEGDIHIFIGCGLLVTVGGYMLSQAYRLAEANLIAPFEYIGMPLAVFWGALLFDELPDRTAMIGISLIVSSGLFVFYRETVRGKPLAIRRPMPRNR